MKRARRWIFDSMAALSLLLCCVVVLLWMRSHGLGRRTVVPTLVSLPLGQGSVEGPLDVTVRGPLRYPAEIRFTYGRTRFAFYALDGRLRLDNWPETEIWARRWNAEFRQWSDAVLSDELLQRRIGLGRGARDDTGDPLEPLYEALLQVERLTTQQAKAPPPALIEHSISCAVPVAVFATLPLWWLVRRGRRLVRRWRGLCPECGYDLRASKDRCPECGAPIVRRRRWMAVTKPTG